jgi:dihydrofolate reductase
MRKIIVLSFISLDGVMQAPGGPDEDKSSGFKYGGWTVPFMDDFSGKMMLEQMSKPFDLLLGRKTYDIFAAYWPKQDKEHPIAKPFNKAVKFVATHADLKPTWENTSVLKGSDVGDQVKKLKNTAGPDLQVHGSGNFIQTLLKNDLVDEMWLKFFPVTLGPGKKLFAEGTIPAAFKLIDTKTSPLGVIFANYRRDGEVKTGTFE